MRRTLRVLLVAAASGVAAIAGGLESAAAADLRAGRLVQVSGASPFAGCTEDDVAGQSGQVFPDSEVEPWIDVNPTDEDNIVGMWQQDRWSNGGARGHVLGVSSNGGSRWRQVVLPKVTVCSGGTAANFGNYQRTTDPWVSFGPDGTLHQISLSFNDIAPPFDPEDFDHALLASKSEDGGLTWTDPEVVIRDLDASVFNDKQSITADPTEADNVYAVWDRLLFPNSEAASVRASFVTGAFRGPVWFGRSTDGGDSWEDARQIYDPGQNDQTISSQIVVPPDGTLINLFAEFNGENTNKLRAWTVRVLRSNDAGETWSAPILVDRLQTISVRDPETGEDVRTGDIVPDVAVNSDNGRLYAVWQDARFSGFQNDSIAFSQSLDGGVTWSDPIKMNLTPTDIPAGNQQAFTPSVDVADDGTIAATYYDFRNNTAAADLKTDYFVVHCHPTTPTACTDPANWVNEIRLTDTSFDMRQAPLTGTGFFTGDYEGLASAGNDFTPFFSQTHGSDPSSAFFRRVGP
ncbi:MAG: sialidase family protein [Solirubrobacterales bacterium]